MVQVIDQSHEGKMAMYMKCTKKKLIEMLISCNEVLKNQIGSKPFIRSTSGTVQYTGGGCFIYTNIKGGQS